MPVERAPFNDPPSHDGRAPSRPPRSGARREQLARIRKLSRFLDSSIRLPGNLRIGVDGLIGLVPGVGDWAGSVVSSYIIIRAAQMGASTGALLLMVLNVLVEVAVGVIPVIGDLFDLAWKANERNVRLLERQLRRSPAAAGSAARLVAAVLLLLLLLLAGLAAAIWSMVEVVGYLI